MDLKKITDEELKKLLTMGRTSGKRMAFEFWLKSLQDTVRNRGKLDEAQIHYVARLLTIPSLISIEPSTIYFPTFDNLLMIYRELFENYNFSHDIQEEPKLMEIAGCQALLLGGFYREAAKKKNTIKNLERLGRIFFTGAAIGKRAGVIRKVIGYYREWEDHLCYLEWYLRNERLVIQKVEKPNKPLIKIVPR